MQTTVTTTKTKTKTAAASSVFVVRVLYAANNLPERPARAFYMLADAEYIRARALLRTPAIICTIEQVFIYEL